MDNRISQLTEEQGPLLDHVHTLEHQITTLYTELAIEFQKKKEMNRVMAQKDSRLEATIQQLNHVNSRLRECEMRIGTFQPVLSFSHKQYSLI